MPSSFTPNRGYELMATGEDYGLWGAKLNAIISSLDTSQGGQFIINNPATSSLTLSQAGNLQIFFTGSLAADATITFPSINGLYIISHNASGNFKLNLAGGGGGLIPLQYGTTMIVISTVYSLVPLYIPENYLFQDTGSANAYVISVITSDFSMNLVTTGKVYKVKIANSNTTASTITINPAGTTKNITTKTGGALAASSLLAGGIYNLTYDGTQFQIL